MQGRGLVNISKGLPGNLPEGIVAGSFLKLLEGCELGLEGNNPACVAKGPKVCRIPAFVRADIQHEVDGILLQDSCPFSMWSCCNINPYFCGVMAIQVQTQFLENAFEQGSHGAFSVNRVYSSGRICNLPSNMSGTIRRLALRSR